APRGNCSIIPFPRSPATPGSCCGGLPDVRRLIQQALPPRVTRLLQGALAPRRGAAPPGALAAGVLDCEVAYNAHGAFCGPGASRHRPAARAILAGRIWEPETLAFLAANGAGGDVVHAGAYFGDFLPALARACGPAGKVWAFEPNDENFRCAQVTV